MVIKYEGNTYNRNESIKNDQSSYFELQII